MIVWFSTLADNFPTFQAVDAFCKHKISMYDSVPKRNHGFCRLIDFLTFKAQLMCLLLLFTVHGGQKSSALNSTGQCQIGGHIPCINEKEAVVQSQIDQKFETRYPIS